MFSLTYSGQGMAGQGKDRVGGRQGRAGGRQGYGRLMVREVAG